MRTRWNKQSYRVTGSKWPGFFSVMLVCLLGAASIALSANDVVNGVQGGVPGQTPPPSQALDVPAVVLPPPAGATVINFDGVPKPCSFILTTALRNDFAALGVTFTGGSGPNDGFAILDQCGNFGVTGHSPPNFLAWNETATLSNGGIPKGPETLTFSPAVSLVQVNAGSPGGGLVKMEAFNAAGGSLGSDSFTLTSALQTLRVTANGIVKVVVTVPVGSAGVLDDLAFVPGAPGPGCDIQLNKTSFVNGDQVIAQVLNITNPTAAALAIEFKFWFEIPGLAPVSFARGGADGSVVLPAGFNQNLGPLTLLTITSSFPRGTYAFNCRFLNPVTGEFLVKDLNPFQVQ